MKITWLGHATLVIETAGTRFITDPLLRDQFFHIRRYSTSVDAPTAVDTVLLSHLHHDHLDMGSLKKVGGPVVGPRGTARTLRRTGRTVSEVKPGDELTVGDARVTVTRADHDGRRWHLAKRYDDDTLGFIVESGGVRTYFAGDTELYDGMRDLRPLDLALVPIWGWGPRLGPGHMDPTQAADAVALLAPKTVVPIHWGTFFPVHMHRSHGHLLAEPAVTFRERCAEVAPDVHVEVIEPGTSVVIPSG
jgi:L-ascorbate metabolism protein UlaG (beta-lactamase superfamily)